MKKPVYKPLGKTVVTEIKHFTVDTVRKSAAAAFRVATRITEATLQELDVTVGPDNPYTLQNVSNVISISCPHPIKAELVSTGEMPVAETRTEQVFSDAVVGFHEPVYAARFVTITVEDKDVFGAGPIQVYVQNMRTGEADYVSLTRKDQGIFTGFIPTQNNDTRGVDFDGVLYCQKGDILEAIYTEPNAANGLSREVQTTTVVELDFAPTEIVVPDHVIYGGTFAFKVNNPLTNLITLKNERTGYTLTGSTYAGGIITLGAEDGPDIFDSTDNDVITITTKGKSSNGTLQDIVATVTVSGVPLVPVINANTTTDIRDEFAIEVVDYNLPESAQVRITNATTGSVNTVRLEPTYIGSGKYSVNIPTLTSFGLPGQLLTLTYTNGDQTVTKNINTIMPQTPECVAVEPNNAIASAPVILTINGHFFLNGSFAGTIKLYADSEVRVTLLKA